MRVLIVEDDPTTLRAVAHAVRDFGYDVETAGDGLSAWRVLQAEKIHIVVTDWMMPGESGIDLIRRVRTSALPNYIYIIMLTVRGKQKDLVEVLSRGADDYIAKPFNPEELRVRLLAAQRIVNLEIRLRDANRQMQAVNERLQADSRLDPLMGIGSRLAFGEAVKALHERARAHGVGYGLVMCDIDHFKRYNDRYGHQSGDQVLQRVAESVSSAVRSSDCAFRYGGEEIVVLLGDSDLDAAAAIARRVRGRVEVCDYGLDGAANPVRVTVSCGVAAYTPNQCVDEHWTDVVEAADQALYAAKRAGRNRVAVTRGGTPEPDPSPEDVEDAPQPLRPSAPTPA